MALTLPHNQTTSSWAYLVSAVCVWFIWGQSVKIHSWRLVWNELRNILSCPSDMFHKTYQLLLCDINLCPLPSKLIFIKQMILSNDVKIRDQSMVNDVTLQSFTDDLPLNLWVFWIGMWSLPHIDSPTSWVGRCWVFVYWQVISDLNCRWYCYFPDGDEAVV